MTTIKYAASGEQRKKLVNALSEILGYESKYLKAPSYGYEIGSCIVNRAGDIEFPDDMTEEEIEAIVKKLTWHGFERALDEPTGEIDGAPALEESALGAEDPTEENVSDAVEATVEESEDVLDDEIVADENKIGATEANKKKALSMGAMVGKEFVDRGASAKSADRPQLQAMLEYVKENADRVDYVIVHKVDRLARNRDDDSDIMRVLRECGVQLVSASESIDDTPAGMLLHGIMSSIAEFYSQNLATEVKKGMGEKIKGGGTVGRAPIGYQNIRLVDDKGREERTVITDPERAPLIKLAFEEYATGNWTVADLADHLAACGLNTRSTPKISSQPVTLKTLHKVLVNPYYKGVVKYKGIEYPGSHEALVDTETWDKVQAILASRINGTRNLKHPHFLKGSIYCAYCGERMMVSNEKKKDGTIYPYFVCSGRHSKRRKDCTTKAVLIDVVEKEIEKIYEAYQLPPEVRILLESCIQEIISTERAKYDAELDGLKGEKAKLENKRKKLLEAHYCDAIPLDLLKSEQQKIAKELASIEHEIKMHDTTFEQITENLKRALDIVENCGEAYKNASDTIKKLMNQAIFEKFYISNDADMEFKVDAEFKPPFDQILEPVKDDIIRINRLAQDCSSKLSYYIDIAKDHIQKIFGCGLYTINNSTNMSTYSNGSNFFSHSLPHSRISRICY